MKMLTAKFVSGLAVAAALVACGDALTDKHYQGEPRYKLTGTIQNLSQVPDEEQVYVGLAWIYEDSGDRVAHETVAVTNFDFPSQFSLALYDNPPAEARMDMSTLGNGAEGELVSGVVYAFQDLDGNGKFNCATGNGDFGCEDSGDAMLAADFSHFIIFTHGLNQAALSQMQVEYGSAFENLNDLQEGYNFTTTICNTGGTPINCDDVTEEEWDRVREKMDEFGNSTCRIFAEGEPMDDTLRIIPQEDIILYGMNYVMLHFDEFCSNNG